METLDHPSNSVLASCISIIISKNIHWLLKITTFVFKLRDFFTKKKVNFYQKMFIKRVLFLTKRPKTGKQKQ